MCILCIFCGVSFNITRIRRKDEPTEAAWYHSVRGAAPFLRVDSLTESFEHCGLDSGCTIYDRDKDDGVYMSPWQFVRQEMASSVSDAMEEARDDDLISETSGREARNLEHVAGPGCNSVDGYSGYLISTEEMQGSSTMRCLVSKEEDWQAAVDDEPFERDADFPKYLSGLHDGMPSLVGGGFIDADMMYPRRHNMEAHHPADTVFDDDEDWSIPFHPACLEVYKRASVKITGKLDMLGLAELHASGTNMAVFGGGFPSSKRADNVGRLIPEGWEGWMHDSGTEYVAANPLFIPGLARVVAESTSSTHEIHSSLGAFDLPANTNLAPSPDDPFADLPSQLLLFVLSLLSNKDIAHLRLVSRVFRQMPIGLWQMVLLRDMPWLWEAWPMKQITPYAFLATTTERRLRAQTYTGQRHVPVPGVLPLRRTNWYKLYCSLKRGLRDGSLKGLRNRARIWADCEALISGFGKTSADFSPGPSERGMFDFEEE